MVTRIFLTTPCGCRAEFMVTRIFSPHPVVQTTGDKLKPFENG